MKEGLWKLQLSHDFAVVGTLPKVQAAQAAMEGLQAVVSRFNPAPGSFDTMLVRVDAPDLSVSRAGELTTEAAFRELVDSVREARATADKTAANNTEGEEAHAGAVTED